MRVNIGDKNLSICRGMPQLATFTWWILNVLLKIAGISQVEPYRFKLRKIAAGTAKNLCRPGDIEHVLGWYAYMTRYFESLSCSELNREHAGEGFKSLWHILTPLWACKAKKCHFSRKCDLWPDLPRSNVDLGPKTVCAIARSRRGVSTVLFREALRPSGADRQGGRTHYPPPPPWPSALWEMPWPGEG